MEKPNLERIWETWIKIGPKNNLTPNTRAKMTQDTIRYKIGLTFPRLMNERTIVWYDFHIHPYPKDPENEYFHIRFSPIKDIQESGLDLPEYCVSSQKVTIGRNIAGIDNALLKNEEIEEALRMIGEQSDWIINLVNIHKDNETITPTQFIQFIHYFMNMIGLGGKSMFNLRGYEEKIIIF